MNELILSKSWCPVDQKGYLSQIHLNAILRSLCLVQFGRGVQMVQITASIMDSPDKPEVAAEEGNNG